MAANEAEPGRLGPLEARVLDAVWSARGDVRVRDVLAALGGRTAYTTVMTTLDRLHRKGVLRRRKQGRAFLYSAQASREELEQRRASRLIAGLLTDRVASPDPILSFLVDAVGDRDRELLGRLEEMVRRKREAK
jgi:predicted transcriptional regulator